MGEGCAEGSGYGSARLNEDRKQHVEDRKTSSVRMKAGLVFMIIRKEIGMEDQWELRYNLCHEVQTLCKRKAAKEKTPPLQSPASPALMTDEKTDTDNAQKTLMILGKATIKIERN